MTSRHNYFTGPASNKVVLILIFVALLVIGLKYFTVSDGRFFVIGDDPSRHLALINSFIEHRGIVYPTDPSGQYTAYIYYAPLFHVTIAALSILTQIDPMAIQNLVPLFCMLAFFVIAYKLLRLFFDDRERPLFVATLSMFFLPIPAPDPHYVVYYVFLPIMLYLVYRIFTKKNYFYFILLFLITLVIALTHDQSILFIFAALSLALIIGIFFFRRAEDLRKMASVWLTSALAYAAAFYLFSFLTPTFWEAILHYFSLTLVDPSITSSLQKMFYATGANRYLVLGVFFLAPIVVFAVIYILAPLINGARNFFSEKIHYFLADLREKLPFQARYVWMLPFAIMFITLAYLLVWSFAFNIIELVSVYLFHPSLPYFAIIQAMNGLYFTWFFGKSGFEGFTLPYLFGLVVLFIIATYAIFRLTKRDEFSKNPFFYVLLAFMLPFLFELLVFPFFNLSKYIDPMILDRFYNYTYPALVIFSVPVLLRAGEWVAERRPKNWKVPLGAIALVVILVFTTMGSVLAASYDINPVQNAGYEWLVSNTPVKGNAAALSFDILGYYHNSKFPLHYAISLGSSEIVAIDLNKNGRTFQPIVAIALLGIKKTFPMGIYFDENPVGHADDKIFDNPQISFYHEGS